MNASRTSPAFHVALILALAALACNAPSGAATETPTPAPAATDTATPEPTATIDPAAGQCIATANQDMNMRTGPGTAWPVVGQLAAGNSAHVTGHNGDRSWWQINDSAWISAPLTTTTGDCSGLLVAAFQPAPTKKVADQDDDDEPDPTKTPTSGPHPISTFVFPIVTFVLADNVAFEIDFSDTWTCASDGRVSFIMYNQGTVPIESVYYSVEYPTGTYINSGTTNNTPFKNAATESWPACSQGGQSSLSTGQGKYIQMYITSVPPGGVEGFLFIEACSQDFRAGTCSNQILYFNF